MCGGDSKCEKCNGKGFYELDKCINYYLNSNAFLFYDSYVMYKSNNILPISGGYLEQSNSFVRNVKMFDIVLNEYEKIKKKRKGK